MIDFNRLTDYSQTILFASQQVMVRMHNTQMEPEHILLAMTEASRVDLSLPFNLLVD